MQREKVSLYLHCFEAGNFKLYDQSYLHTLSPSYRLRHVLTTWGQKFTEDECDAIMDEASVDSRGKVDIKRLATLVTRGANDDGDE